MKDWAGFAVDPLVVRGELLMEKRAAGTATAQDLAELESCELAIKAREKHLAAYPMADSAEESAVDLSEEQARDRDEFLVWLKEYGVKYGLPALRAIAGSVVAQLGRR